MPLASNLPLIDNRTYDDIVAEARGRIPRYAPEWTDLNDNEPGMALVQLLAWLTEMQLYRLGQVPQLNYLKFLELLGMELLPAEPAAAEITFPAASTATSPVIMVPQGTQVSAASGDSPTPLVFETDRALIALGAQLVVVQAFDGYAFADVSTMNEAGTQEFQPFGSAAPEDSALYLGFRAPPPFPEAELNLAAFRREAGAVGEVSCDALRRTAFPSAQVTWEYCDGTVWHALDVLKDETQALMRSGHLYFKLPPANTLQLVAVGRRTDLLYYIRGRVTRAGYERAPTVLTMRTNTVSATQAQTARDEVLGGSDGSPHQKFPLAHSPVLRDTLVLEVDEGGPANGWTRVDDFFASGPRDRHYLLNRTTGEIQFGDGAHGAIPVGNPAKPDSSIVARRYRFGGGKLGNVGAGQIKTLLVSVDGIDDGKVSNLLAAVGGRDEETLREAQLRVPRAVRSRCRAVTAEDFEVLATQAGNVKRAKALPLTHPSFPGVEVPGVVTVIVVPDSEDPKPTPSEGMLRNVCAYLNQARVLTTELYVMPPTYQQVHVRAQVVAEDNADLADVKTTIEQTLLGYFHPLKGGEDGSGWPFGGAIYFSRVFGHIAVPGVQRVEQVVISVDGREAAPCTDVPICDGVLVYSTDHNITVSYSLDG